MNLSCKNHVHKYKCDFYREDPNNCKKCDLRLVSECDAGIVINSIRDIVNKWRSDSNESEEQSSKRMLEIADLLDNSGSGEVKNEYR